MKGHFVVAILTALLTLTVCAVAGNIAPQSLSDEVQVQGQILCSIPDGGAEFCPAFAGPFNNLPNQEIRFYDPGTQILSDVLYIQNSFLYFVSDDNGVITDPGFFVVKNLDETGDFQEVAQYMVEDHDLPGPALTIEVKSDLVAVPEPSTIVLVAGPALLYFSRKRFWRA
jgi:hypothetical protein